ncbi:MAG: response regulator transcription factor [Balneolaceae bacterium]|nr:response regulator transcription factor [Balneolaceae bacterium]MBO6545755.1 response regulator transcription factor [Balneolaceae bacterium]MBO6647151.1 response regulator transcription factor [Balneolaceae bacterium]
MKYTALIIDDEKEARDGVKKLLEEINDIEVTGTAKNGLEAIKLIDRKNPDIIFLDIQMPEVNGFEVLSSINSRNKPLNVIFVTAYDEYALKAFEVHAIDYLLKPFSDSRFLKAVEKVKNQLALNESLDQVMRVHLLLKDFEEKEAKKFNSGTIVNESGRFKEKLAIKTSGKIVFINLIEILWIAADSYYVMIHSKEKKYLVRSSLKEMADKLPEEYFLRIHKSTIINLKFIEEVEAYSHGEYVVKLKRVKERLKVSRSYSKAFSRWLKKQ